MKRSKAKKGRHEVVRVLTPAFLVSSDQQACRYETAAGSLLTPGYYLALWPTGVRHATYGCAVRYFGPFATQAEARLLQTSATALDLVEAAIPIPIPATPDANCGQYCAADDKASGISPPRQFEWGDAIWIGQGWIDANLANREICAA